jgi:hypothetical protein
LNLATFTPWKFQGLINQRQECGFTEELPSGEPEPKKKLQRRRRDGEA